MYTYEQALFNFPYLRLNRLMIYNISFVHNLHEYSLQVLIDSIGFTVERISNFIISRHCYRVSFWSKCWAKWATKVSEFLSYHTIWATSWKCCYILFFGCFECFPHKLNKFFCTSPFKIQNMLYIHFHRQMFLLPWPWN